MSATKGSGINASPKTSRKGLGSPKPNRKGSGLASPKEEVTLKVYIGSAYKLKLRDANKSTKIDAYACIEYKGQIAETDIIERTINPKWSQTFEFIVADKSALGELVVTVNDTLGTNKKRKHGFHGEVRIAVIDFSNVNFDMADSHRYELKPKSNNTKEKEKVGGSIDVKVGMNIPKSKLARNSGNSRIIQNIDVDNASVDELNAASVSIIDDNYNRAKQLVALTQSICDTSNSTLEQLEDQGDRLNNINRDLDDIEISQRNSRQHMRVIESPWGGVKNKFERKGSNSKKAKAQEMHREMEKANNEQQTKDRQRESKKKIREQKVKSKRNDSSDNFDNNYSHDLSDLPVAAQQKDAKTDKCLDQIGDLIEGLKLSALAQRDELISQEKLVQKVQNRVQAAGITTKEQNQFVGKKIKK